MKHRVVVLGSGPAGLTAALYLSRANLAPTVFEGVQPGGQLTITTEVDNYPGFPEGILGPELMERMKAQCARFGTTYSYEEIIEADLSKRPFVLTNSSGEKTECDALIIATGATARWLGLPSEKKMMGHGVSACATCDGFFFRDVPVAVVGGGDTAVEEATFLTKFASRVILLHRRHELRASKIMQKRALDNPKIEMHWNQTVTDVLDVKKGKVTGVELMSTKNGEKKQVAADGLFLAIGHQPNTELFRGVLDMDDKGYIQTVPGKTATNIPGVFAAGDCQDSYYRQAVTAAGSGCMAAIEAERWLEEQHHK